MNESETPVTYSHDRVQCIIEVDMVQLDPVDKTLICTLQSKPNAEVGLGLDSIYVAPA